MSDNNDKHIESASLDEALEFIYKLIYSTSLPLKPDLLKENDKLSRIYDYLVELRGVVSAFSKGDFSPDIKIKGFLGGSLKNLQANLCHLIWQVEMVASGDFSQRVEFMGEFATAFNSMVVRLHRSLEDLRQQEELLTSFTENLKQEIAVRIKAEEALRLSEERYKALATLDPLTGQYNRRQFFHLAIAEFARIQRCKGIMSLCMLDVDMFKKFNDTYGHLNGDICLRHIAEISRASLRKMDIQGRYGGEEFIFIFPETDHDNGMLVAERLRSTLASTPVKLEDGKEVFVTASIGLTEVRGDNMNPDVEQASRDSIQAADDALYKAKADGRNRVVSSRDVKAA